jgi:hypothetical protein
MEGETLPVVERVPLTEAVLEVLGQDVGVLLSVPLALTVLLWLSVPVALGQAEAERLTVGVADTEAQTLTLGDCVLLGHCDGVVVPLTVLTAVGDTLGLGELLGDSVPDRLAVVVTQEVGEAVKEPLALPLLLGQWLAVPQAELEGHTEGVVVEQGLPLMLRDPVPVTLPVLDTVGLPLTVRVPGPERVTEGLPLTVPDTLLVVLCVSEADTLAVLQLLPLTLGLREGLVELEAHREEEGVLVPLRVVLLEPQAVGEAVGLTLSLTLLLLQAEVVEVLEMHPDTVGVVVPLGQPERLGVTELLTVALGQVLAVMLPVALEDTLAEVHTLVVGLLVLLMDPEPLTVPEVLPVKLTVGVALSVLLVELLPLRLSREVTVGEALGDLVPELQPEEVTVAVGQTLLLLLTLAVTVPVMEPLLLGHCVGLLLVE